MTKANTIKKSKPNQKVSLNFASNPVKLDLMSEKKQRARKINDSQVSLTRKPFDKYFNSSTHINNFIRQV